MTLVPDLNDLNIKILARRALQSGDGFQSHVVGYRYETGTNAPNSRLLALAFYKKATKAGFLPARHSYARLLEESGKTKQALVEYKQSANEGFVASLYDCGRLLIESNPSEAMQCWESAIREDAQQTPPACFRDLANEYYIGRYVLRDIGKAVGLYTEAAARHDKEAHAMLGKLYSVKGVLPSCYPQRDLFKAATHFLVAGDKNSLRLFFGVCGEIATCPADVQARFAQHIGLSAAPSQPRLG